jgi:hypothetical protein
MSSVKVADIGSKKPGACLERQVMAIQDEQKKRKESKTKAEMENRDALSGEKRAQPVGVGVRTAVGGGVGDRRTH